MELEPENVQFRIGLASLLVRLGKQGHAYFLVKRFSAAQLREISCIGCLRRIGAVDARHGDAARELLVQPQLVGLLVGLGAEKSSTRARSLHPGKDG